MKRFKKMMAIAIVAVMTMMYVVPMSFAEPEPEPAAAQPTGSITVKPSASDPSVKLDNKTLKAYKILDVTYSPATGDLEENEKQAISYTIPAKMIDFFNDYFATKDANGNIEQDTTGDSPVNKDGKYYAAKAGQTFDVYVFNQMKDWGDDSAKTKDFAYAALAAAKAAGVEAITGTKSGQNVVFSNQEAGYYVIEDEGTAVPISAVMLDTVTDADVEINLKASDDTKKEIMTVEGLLNAKANELGLGRAVNYKISQKIPDYTGYDYYYYMINDTLSPGLTFNPDSVVVKVTKPAADAEYAGQSAYATPAEASAAGFSYNEDKTDDAVNYWVKAAKDAETYTLSKDTDYHLYYDNGAKSGDENYDDQIAAILNGKTFIIAFDDIVSNSKTNIEYSVEVTYTATVNSDAVVGVDPNNNKVNIEYSNNPDKDGKGDWDTNHPGIPKNDGNHPTGVGPDKFTDTYTTQINIHKVDGSDDLEGVEFTLTGKAKDAVFKTEQTFDIDPDGDYWLLKDGTYTTTAPSTEAKVEETTGGAGWVEIGANEEVDEDVPVRVVGEKSYRPYVEATDSTKTRYTIVEENTGDYASITTKYSLSTKKSADAAEEYDVMRSGITDSNGKLDFSQLGAGTYKLSETGVLAGYNGISDIEFKIECTLPEEEDVVAGTETATWKITSLTDGVNFVADKVKVKDPETGAETEELTGTFTVTIENNKGTELPSTGGIGTTLFYLIGGILIIGAGVLLVTRRRVDNAE